MEKAKNVAVVQGSFERIDVGALSSLAQLLPKDEKGNARQGLLIEKHSRRNIVYTDEGLVGLVGVEDLVVIRRGDVVLVCPVDRAAEVKDLVSALEAGGLERFR
jgi:mannose-1-phosphate guanylyltransferase